MRPHLFITGLLWGCALTMAAQTSSADAAAPNVEVWPEKVQPKIADTPLEVFCGVDLHYADVNFLRLYNTLVNLTPGVKWNMGNDWQLAAQAWVPIINDGFETRYNMIRLSTLALSKELHFSSIHQNLKISAGLFGKERWGADLKWMMPVTDWLMVQAQGGLTRHWALGFALEGGSESEFTVKNEKSTAPKDWVATATVGARVYLRPWDTEFVATGGQYLYKDKGLQFEAMRHFKYCTVSLYGQLHKRRKGQYTNHREAGGFKIIVMLDRKGWRAKTHDGIMQFRPASNFRLTYNAQSDTESMRSYTTDPEENERILPMRIY